MNVQCPFCGRPATLSEYDYRDESTGYRDAGLVLQCAVCGEYTAAEIDKLLEVTK